MIRDFIYLDADRLYSVYSQVFEGVAEQIVQSYVDELSSTQQSSSPLRGASVETQVAEITRRTENRLLYDHMYSQLETKIGPELLDPSDEDVDKFLPLAADAAMVKVRGVAEVEDYSRMKVLIDKFNEIGQAIAHAAAGDQLDVNELEAEITKIKDRNQRARAKAQLKATGGLPALAKQMGLQQDERLLNSLRLFTEVFNPEGLDVVITMPTNPDLAFKAVLDRKWLRVPPHVLRPLHAGLPAGAWTIVGHVTHVPGFEPELDEASGDDANMRDAFRGMFRAARAFEKVFFESKQRTEVIVAPIAVYREAQLGRTHKQLSGA